MRLISRPAILVNILFVSAVVGCGQSGPSLGRVNGTVEMNGAPVPEVRVVFVPLEKGSPAYGVTNKNGEFRMLFSASRDGALVGDHSVLIESLESDADQNGKRVNPQSVVVPKKYLQPGALSATVIAGRNHFEFELDPN